MNNLNQKLENWTKNVMVSVAPILEKYDWDFYPFQAPVNFESKTLIIGLNPAGYFDKDYRKKTFVNSLSHEYIISGNKEYKNRDSWKIYKNMMKIDFIKKLDNNFNYMNFVYFPTPKFNDIKQIKDLNVIEICRNLTIEFIKILNPELIIVLGTSSGIDIIAKNTKTILNGFKKRLVVQGDIEGIKAFGIPHPSYDNSQIENEEISKVLKLSVSGKEIKPFGLKRLENHKKNISNSNIDIVKINDRLKEFGFVFHEFNNKSKIFKATCNGFKNDVLDFRLDISKKYLGIRSEKKIGSSYFKLEGRDFYKKIFSTKAEFEKEGWLIYKKFKNDLGNSFEEKISDDIRYLIESIKISENED